MLRRMGTTTPCQIHARASSPSAASNDASSRPHRHPHTKLIVFDSEHACYFILRILYNIYISL